jgi:hypothetical protein
MVVCTELMSAVVACVKNHRADKKFLGYIADLLHTFAGNGTTNEKKTIRGERRNERRAERGER